MYLYEGRKFEICTDVVDIGCFHCSFFVMEMKNNQAVLISII